MLGICAAAALMLASCTADVSAGDTQPEETASESADTVKCTSDTLYVRKTELSDDFILGCDVSTVISLEKSGVKYYDRDGSEADLFKVLADSGVNCIRVRVWNDPFDASGNGYGGGNCDTENAVEIAKRAKAAGLGLMIDYHCSDFWADPSKQMVPKAWQDMEIDDKKAALYDFVKESLGKIKDTGADIRIVQIGNETNGKMSGEKIWMSIYYLMDAGSRAVRETCPDALVAVHFTNPESADNMKNYASKLAYYDLDYDIFASSYYPYWHGTPENLTSVLKEIGDTYDKKVMCAETSYAYTLEDGDGSPNSIGDAANYEKRYPITVQGQSREIADVIRAVSEVGDRGIGVFYWEPAWIPVPGSTKEERSALWEKYGSGWASSYSASYDPDDAGIYYGGSAWDNQALFDFSGRPLESLKTFSLIRCGNEIEPVPDAIKDSELIFRTGEEVRLPGSVSAIYTDGSEKDIAVEWESTDLAAMSSGGPQNYSVSGKAGGMDAVCRIHIVDANYCENYSFEDPDRSMWEIENINEKTTQIDWQEKAMDAVTGDYALHFWGENGTEFRACQKITDIPAGKYTLSASVQGGFSGSDDSQEIYIFLDVNGEEYTAPAEISGWCVWNTPKTAAVDIPEGADVTIGIYVKAGAQSWGTIDDFLLNPAK